MGDTSLINGVYKPTHTLKSTILPLFFESSNGFMVHYNSMEPTNFGLKSDAPEGAGADKHGRNSRRTWELLWDPWGKQQNLERTQQIGISARKVAQWTQMDPNARSVQLWSAHEDWQEWNKYRSIDVTWKELKNKQHKFIQIPDKRSDKIHLKEAGLLDS